jgi:hypothetical protein
MRFKLKFVLHVIKLDYVVIKLNQCKPASQSEKS